jgi:hypothetical protein
MKIIKLNEIIRKDKSTWYGEETVELKMWTLDEILRVNIIEGATPAYVLDEAGFIFEESIDIKELFGDYLEKTGNGNSKISIVSNTSDGVQSRPWTSSKGKRNLKSVKEKLEKILNKLDYQTRELIVFRTFKGGYPTNWDSIGIFSTKLV